MEVSSRLLSKAVDGVFLSGLSVGGRLKCLKIVSHLLLANDTLIFCGSNMEQIGNLKCVLLFFKAVSGLKINLGKSEIVPVGEVNAIEAFASMLGCKISNLPLKYLGLPLDTKFKYKGTLGSDFGKHGKKISEMEEDLFFLISTNIYSKKNQ